MDMTVRQISEELGVSRQRIYRYIRANNPRYHYIGSGKTMYFADEEVRKMKKAFAAEDDVEAEQARAVIPADTVVISADDAELRSRIAELEKKLAESQAESSAKDRRIAELDGQRQSLMESLNKSTECIKELSSGMRSLTDSLRAAQVMQMDTVRRLDTERRHKKSLSHDEPAAVSFSRLLGRLFGSDGSKK